MVTVRRTRHQGREPAGCRHGTRIAAALALLLLLLPHAGLRAQALPSLFERLGDTIDPYEREYFGLFPGLEGFTSASLLVEGDRLRFVVHRSAGAADSSIELSHRQALLLERLVDKYESILQTYPAAEDDTPDDPDRQGFELRFGPLLQGGMLRLRRVSENDVPRVTILLRNGETLRGSMLFVRDCMLALRTADGPFSWRSADSGIVMLRISRIEAVTVSTRMPFGRYAATGFFFGMGLTMLAASAYWEELGDRYALDLDVGDLRTLLGVTIAGGFIPSMVFTGILAVAFPTPVDWSAAAVLPAWKDTVASKRFFACTGLPPPEWSPGSAHLARAAAAGAAITASPVMDDIAGTASSSMPARRGFPVVWSIAADFGVNYYGSYNRDVGAFGGVSLAAELPLLERSDGTASLVFQPRAGLGLTYLYGEASLRVPISRRLSLLAGRVSLLAGLSGRWQEEDFGYYCWPSLHAAIEQDSFLDYLFWHGGMRFEYERSYLELRVGAPVNRIVVTSSDGGNLEWCWVPRPLGFVSAQLSLGWRL